MPKIPLWMADIKVKFVCDEARQKSTPSIGLIDSEISRKSISGGATSIADVSAKPTDADSDDYEEDEEAVAEEAVEDELEA